MVMSIDQNFSRVSDAVVLETSGPWQSKSGGTLSVLFSLTAEQTAVFQDYNNPEFDKIATQTGTNIRGMRVYNVENIPNGSTGANEFHLARTEIVNVLSGKSLWRLEDVYGDVKEFTLDSAKSLIVPAGILHTYTALEDKTRLQVICNTLFIPDDPRTHDSYMIDEFRQLQQNFN
jgi:dTDP-4-dehydrorhamnose 3,5-epimerase-like enzyme